MKQIELPEEKIQQLAEKYAMEGAEKAIREYYTGYNSPYMKMMEEHLKAIAPNPRFDLPDLTDEKVKKQLINAINLAYDCGIAITKENRDKYLAWIERQGDVIPYVEKLGKQGEPTEINSEFDSQLNGLLEKFKSLPKEELASSLSFYLNVVQNDGTYKEEEKQGEQKPSDKCEGCNNAKGCVACVDGSEWAHIEESEPAWSEKDFMYETLSNLTELKDRYGEGYGNVGKCIDWLRTLKKRIQPQNTWKPSKEQIIALRWILNNIPYNKHKEEISGLLDQINELNGE